MEASVAATPAAPAQGADTQTTQPQANGQGGGANQATGQQGGFNWGLFPNVPENMRELLQPHLRDTLGHVTRIEQQYAPYKGLTEAVSPDQVQNLVQFLQGYSNDPMSTWMGMAQSLVEDGTIQNPELMQQLQQLVQGGQQQQQMPGQEDMPPWAQQMAQQLAHVQQAEQQRQQEAAQQTAQAEQQQQQAMLTAAITDIKGQLTASGIPEAAISNEMIVSSIIANQGDVSRAVASFSGFRDAVLTGFTNTNANGSRPPTINGKPPEAPKGGLAKKAGDGFREASLGAAQMLASSSRAEQQG